MSLKNANKKNTGYKSGSTAHLHKDFVKSTNDEILSFIQNSIRNKNMLEKDLEQLTATQKDEENTFKSELMDLEEVKSLGTGAERTAKVNSLLQIKMKDSKYLNEISHLKNQIYDIKNELNLAREIYKLKNI